MISSTINKSVQEKNSFHNYSENEQLEICQIYS